MNMDSSSPYRLRVWDRGPTPAPRQPDGYGIVEPPAQGPHSASEVASRLYIAEALQPPRSVMRRLGSAEPYSLEWFLNAEKLRHSRPGRWIPKLLEFTKHSGDNILCLGHGLGTDWLQYARHGASVVVCSPSNDHLGLVRRNFDLRGLEGRFLHASPSSLPLESGSIDVACIVGLLEFEVDPQSAIGEVYRVLKPGGKVLAVTPAWFDVDFWQRCAFFWMNWLPGKDRAKSEATQFSARTLRRMFGRFVEHGTHKRHLRRTFVPHVWRWVPLPLLERVMGRYVVLKAFKPLSAALPAATAAAA
jgi:SAM-dependent methyltransferase